MMSTVKWLAKRYLVILMGVFCAAWLGLFASSICEILEQRAEAQEKPVAAYTADVRKGLIKVLSDFYRATKGNVVTRYAMDGLWIQVDRVLQENMAQAPAHEPPAEAGKQKPAEQPK